MAVARRLNIIGQWRLDVPHVRQIESAVAYDFDSLAGGIMAGYAPLVVRGFEIIGASVGADPTTLQLVTASGIILHQGASQNGTILRLESDSPAQTLNAINDRVVGSFATDTTNYIGIDYTFEADPTTSDVVQFLDPIIKKETPKVVPLAKTLDYQIVISTTPFTARPTICPVAIIVTDADGNVKVNGTGGPDVQDAREMYFRLAAGSDSPDPLNTYSWPQLRNPESIYSFSGGDKAITNERDWKRSVMTRIWEITGGEYWYSDTTDKNVRFTSTSPTVLSDNIVAAPIASPGPINVKWEKLSIILSNSTATYNTITDDTSIGIDLTDGQCLYVDINRFTNATLTIQQGTTASLGSPTIPGTRFVLVWVRNVGGTLYAYSRFSDGNEVGRGIALATASVYGIVKFDSDIPSQYITTRPSSIAERAALNWTVMTDPPEMIFRLTNGLLADLPEGPRSCAGGVSSNGHFMHTSDYGATWTDVDLNPLVLNLMLTDIATSRVHWIVGGISPSAGPGIFHSLDGSFFTFYEYDIPTPIEHVAVSTHPTPVVVAVHPTNIRASSVGNLNIWADPLSLPTPGAGEYWRGARWEETEFIAWTRQTIIRSSGDYFDALTWTIVVDLAFTSGVILDVRKREGIFLVLKDNGETYRSGDDGVTWTGPHLSNALCNEIAYGNGVFVLARETTSTLGDCIYTTTDGIRFRAYGDQVNGPTAEFLSTAFIPSVYNQSANIEAAGRFITTGIGTWASMYL